MGTINEQLDVLKASLHNANELVDIKNNPVVDSLLLPTIKAIPIIGDMIDSSMNKIIEEFQNKKEQELIEVILKDSHSITSEMVNDVEFIVNYAKAKEAVRRLATNDKVKYFGNLIRNGYLSGEHIENSRFEEYLDMLNTMSYREIRYMLFLMQHPMEEMQWHEFTQLFHNEFGESDENPYYIYLKLKRTGFIYEEFQVESTSVSGNNYGDYQLDYNAIESNYFSITSLFEEFYKMVLEDN